MFFTLKRTGIGLILLGILLLAAEHVLRFTMVNTLLLLPLLLIVAGVCAYVWGQKRESGY